MRYREFQEQLQGEVRAHLAKEVTCELQSMRKNNGVEMAALCIRAPGEEIAPSIYLDYYYEEYRQGMSLPEIAGQILEQYEEARTKRCLPEGFFSTYRAVRDRIYCRLVNQKKNEELLAGIPHERWQDLAVTYYYQMEASILPEATIQIRTEHLRRWGIEEEELKRDAWANTLADRPPKFSPLSDILAESGECGEAGQESNDRDETGLALLTNERRTLGAVCICYPGEAERIAGEIGRDFYILPSSIHECLILPDDGNYDREQLDRMVQEVNRTQLAPQDILADRVYHYDRTLGIIA